jgi:uncharacterized protein (TIGR00251 family)
VNLDGWQIRESNDGLDLIFHVQPRASRNELSGIHNCAMKIRLAAPPVDDAANRALIDFLCSVLDIPKSRCRIKAGLRARTKTVHIIGLSRAQLMARFTDAV